MQVHDKLFKQHVIRDDQGSRARAIDLLVSALVSSDTYYVVNCRIGIGIAGRWAYGTGVRAGEVFRHVQALDTQPPTLSILSYISWWTALAHAGLYWNVESNPIHRWGGIMDDCYESMDDSFMCESLW